MITREMIREIAEFQSVQGDAITFYYQPATPQDKSHRNEAIEIKDLVRDAMRRAERTGKNGNVRSDLERILDMADRLHGNAGKAKAVFACASRGYWRELDLPARVGGTRLVMNTKFSVRPLAEITQLLEKTCICLVDRSKARFFTLQMNEVTEQETFVDELPRRGRSDGFAGFNAGHAERKVDNEAMNHFKRVGERLLEKYGAGTCQSLLIGCRDDSWSLLERQLHPYVKQRLVARFVIDPATASIEDVRRHAERILEKYAQHQRHDLLKEVLDQSRADNHGSIGLWRTLRALEQGEVQTILLGEGFSAEGVECTNCGHLDMRMVEKCAVCGQKTRGVHDITDGLIERALRLGVDVIHIPSDPEFQKAGNIGALLRFRAERSVGARLA